MKLDVALVSEITVTIDLRSRAVIRFFATEMSAVFRDDH